jgi:F-box domain
MLDFLDWLAVVTLAFFACSMVFPAPCRPVHNSGMKLSPPQSNPRLDVRVPIEIVAEIIRHLQHHEVTLRSCSLVCRTWVPLSRRHLFSSIHFDHSNVSAFVALLNSGSSIGAFVQQVTIRREMTHPLWMKEALPVLSSYLHPTSLNLNIQNSFHLDYLFFEAEGYLMFKENLSIFREAFRETVQLTLSLDCDTFVEGVQVVCSFPLLESLEVHGDWSPGLHALAHVPCDLPNLPSRVRNVACFQGSSAFFLWLLRQPHPLSVLNLSLRDTYITETVKSYIQTLGDTLEHLSFEPNFHQSSSHTGLIDISRNFGLRSIVLHSRIDVISTAFHLLSQVGSADVDKVEIGLSEYEFPSNLADLGPPELWSKLDVLMSTPQFSKLRELMITLPWCSGPKLERLLPMSTKRGILRIPARW